MQSASHRRLILLISARAIVINRVFARECYVSAMEQPQSNQKRRRVVEEAWVGVKRQRNNRGVGNMETYLNLFITYKIN